MAKCKRCTTLDIWFGGRRSVEQTTKNYLTAVYNKRVVLPWIPVTDDSMEERQLSSSI